MSGPRGRAQKPVRSKAIRVDGDAAIRALGWTPREGQVEATAGLIRALFSPAKVIAFTAPTGSGKSGMTLAAIRWVKARAIFATPTKQLQMQYHDAFGLLPLYGRGEYDCPISPTGKADLAPCIAGQPCLYRGVGRCSYLAARESARERPIVVVNHSLLLISRIVQDDLSHPVVVIDECHRFLDAARSTLTPTDDDLKLLEELDWDPSKVKTRLSEALIANNVGLASRLVRAQMLAACRRLGPELFDRELTNQTLFRSKLFRGGRLVLVSATIPNDIVPDVLVEGPPQVPPDMRPLIVIPVAAVNVDNQLGLAGRLAVAAKCIIDTLDSNSPVIIHTGTTVLAKAITDELARTSLAERLVPAWGTGRKQVTSVRREPGRQIIIGPALMDGVDLPSARLQIIVKIPFPQKQEGGAQEAAIQLVQAYGRLVRGPNTSGTTVVLDANFRIIHELLPPYVKEAVRWEHTTKTQKGEKWQ